MNLNDGKPYKPLVITSDGIVIGGCMRLRAMRELGFKEVEVSIISTNNEKEMMEISLSDNDNAGYTDKEMLLAEIENMPDLKFDDYAVQLEEPETLTDFMGQFKIGNTDEKQTDDSKNIEEPKLIKCPECGFEFNT